MDAKQRMQALISEIKEAADNADIHRARMAVRQVADRWQGEINQMFDDKENRIIFGACVGAALCFGFMVGLLF